MHVPVQDGSTYCLILLESITSLSIVSKSVFRTEERMPSAPIKTSVVSVLSSAKCRTSDPVDSFSYLVRRLLKWTVHDEGMCCFRISTRSLRCIVDGLAIEIVGVLPLILKVE